MENIPKLKLCRLCDTCGFLNNSQVGVLQESMGLLEIIANQTLFPCHETLNAYNLSNHNEDSENTGTRRMAEETGSVPICSGYIQSMKKSGMKPKNKFVAELMSQIKSIDNRIMTIQETITYHRGEKNDKRKYRGARKIL